MFNSTDRFGDRGDTNRSATQWQVGGLGCYRFEFGSVGVWLDGSAKPQAADGASDDHHRAMRELCGLGY